MDGRSVWTTRIFVSSCQYEAISLYKEYVICCRATFAYTEFRSEFQLLVYPQDRQWSHDRDVLTQHRDSQTDSFILFIKSTILLSRVKTFNLRFKGKHYNRDASVISPNNSPVDGESTNPDQFDIKDAPAFQELESTIQLFKSALPHHLKDPVPKDGQPVDPYLYTAALIPCLYVLPSFRQWQTLSCLVLVITGHRFY